MAQEQIRCRRYERFLDCETELVGYGVRQNGVERRRGARAWSQTRRRRRAPARVQAEVERGRSELTGRSRIHPYALRHRGRRNWRDSHGFPNIR